MKHIFIFICFLVTITSCQPNQQSKQSSQQNNTKTNFNHPPEWSKSVIWYEIAVERFRNGDPSNDPTASDIEGAYPGFVPKGWKTTSWTQDWYKEDAYFKNTKKHKNFYGDTLQRFADKVQMRRYGGDLQGVLDKVDYLDSLGITAVYFRPLNDAPSLHKYDARNWRHIDRNFGPNPQKDAETIRLEIPDDPSTWKFTEADKLFLKVIDAFHKKGIKIILDYSWNHTGKTFWAWQDILKNQEKSKFKDWFWIDSFDDPKTPENEFKYHGWSGVHELPEIKETQKQDLTVDVEAFEGDIYSKAVKQHIFAITKRWLDPNGDGDTSDGIDGYRLDVAAETPLDFWRDFRKHIRGINPDAYLLGEIWWQEWPDKLLDPAPFLKGDIFDAVMNYRWFKSTRHLFNEAPHKIPVSEFLDSIQKFKSNISPMNNYAMMNYTCGFDTPRLLTSLFNKNKYKYKCKVHDDANYKIHKPDTDTYQTLKLLLAHQYTYIGAPHIWAGDEMGMWGADDPSCRKPLIWSDYTFENETTHPLNLKRPTDTVSFNNSLFDYYRTLIKIRKEQPALIYGDIEFINQNDSEILMYRRFNKKEEILVIFNLSSSVKEISYNKERETYTDLLNEKTFDSSKISLPPRTVLILKKKV